LVRYISPIKIIFNKKGKRVKKQHNVYRYFVGIFLTLFLLSASFIITFNLIVDPYNLYKMPQIEGFNKIKVELEKHERLYQAVEIARQKPKVILLGSSRVMFGFDPQDVFQLVQEKVYSGGIPSPNFEEIYHYFEHTLYHQPQLKTVILGLDLFMFNRNGQPKARSDLWRLKSSPLVWKDIFSSLASKSACYSSYTTIKANLMSSSIPYFISQGQLNPDFALSEKNVIFGEGGDEKYLQLAFLARDGYFNYQLDERKVNLFRQLVKTCQDRGIDLKVFISPTKAMYWEAIYQNGLWPVLENWKRQLSQFHPIWDFSGFNCATTQTLEKATGPLYFDCSHFRPSLGKIILEKMFSHSNFPEDFGYLLKPELIDSIFERLHLQRMNWLKRHEEISKKTKTQVSSISLIGLKNKERYHEKFRRPSSFALCDSIF
jgi:hypothetical protein